MANNDKNHNDNYNNESIDFMGAMNKINKSLQ